jgi:hypothetical protein
MKKKVLVVALALAMLALPMSAVSATKPDKFVEVGGEVLAMGPPSMEIMPAGKSDNLIMDVLVTHMWEGGISGTGTVEVQWIMHNSDDPENTWVNVLGLITLTGEVAGLPGTVTIKFSSVSNTKGHWRIIGGTGELANVQGQGTLTPISQMLIEYEGVVHFNP